MTDYKIIRKREAVDLAMAGKTVKAIDFDNEILYDVNLLSIFELSDICKNHNILFVVKGKYGLEKN